MDDQRGPSGLDTTLCQEIIEAGGLVSALQRECDSNRLPYRPRAESGLPGSERTAVVEDGDRCTRVALGGRHLAVTLRRGRVAMARGHLAGLPTVVSVMHRWQSGTRLPELASEFPFFGSVELAEARERGDLAEFTWRLYYENPCQTGYVERLRSLIDVAFHTPRVRGLVPLASRHFTVMRFRAMAGAPFGGDGPSVERLSDETYLVRTAGGHELGVGDASCAVALLLVALGDMSVESGGRTAGDLDGPHPRG